MSENLISTNAPATHERIIAAFVTVANSRESRISGTSCHGYDFAGVRLVQLSEFQDIRWAIN